MNLNATLFAQMIVFFVLWWVVARFVWPPLVKALDERSSKIADGLAAAERGKEALALASNEAEQELTKARQEGVQRVAEAEKRAQMSAEEIRVNAQAEAARIISKLPKMIPGKQRGKPVRVPFSVPITFRLN